ncbi:MAG: HDOD domain-containing protein [Chloroflexi bacterium]|nr:HDOD domain-containing protein [Chloroflexota bacterium]
MTMQPASPASLSSQRLNDILKSVSRLRPLPGSAVRILKALDDPSSTAGQVADIIALDQALTAYLLRAANSAALSSLIGCTTVSDAVMRLGFKQVRSLVYSTVAAGPLSTRLSGYRQGDMELWHHSIAAATAAHWLATALHYPDPEKAYVAGLLHDLGKLLLDQYVLADYNQIEAMMRSQQAPLYVIEEHLFGVDHAAVGGLMATQWQFPSELVDAIRYHHTPSMRRGQQRLAAIVNLANAMSPPPASGLGALEGRSIHPEALDVLKLNPETVEKYRARLDEILFNTEGRFPAV